MVGGSFLFGSLTLHPSLRAVMLSCCTEVDLVISSAGTETWQVRLLITGQLIEPICATTDEQKAPIAAIHGSAKDVPCKEKLQQRKHQSQTLHVNRNQRSGNSQSKGRSKGGKSTQAPSR